MAARKHHVYMAHFGAGVVGYVGRTSRLPKARWSEHARDKDWWPLVTEVFLVSSHTHERTAKLVEKALIKLYAPVANTIHNPNGPDRPAIEAALEARKKPRRAARPTGPTADLDVARLRMLWEDACDAVGLSRRVNGTVRRPSIVRPKAISRHVVRFEYHVGSSGGNIRQLQAAAGDLAAALHVHRVSVEPVSEGQAYVHVAHTDPMPGTVEWRPPATANAMRWRIGRTEADEPVYYDLHEGHCLFAGVTGSGKSAWMRSIIAGASTYDGLVLVGIDPKRTELAPWAPRFTHLAVTDDEIIVALQRTLAEMDRRQRWMADRNVVNMNDAWETRDPAAPPPLILVVDEMANLFRAGDMKKYATPTFKKLLSESRAAGIRIVAATQAPHERIIDTDARQNFSIRIGGATEGPNQTMTIFGADLAPYAQCDLLPLGRGLAYLKRPGQKRVPLCAGDFMPPHVIVPYVDYAVRWRPHVTLTDRGIEPDAPIEATYTPHPVPELPAPTHPNPPEAADTVEAVAPAQQACPVVPPSPGTPIRGVPGDGCASDAAVLPVVVGGDVGLWVERCRGLRSVPKVVVPVGHPLRPGGGPVGVHRVIAFEGWGGGGRVCEGCGVGVGWVVRPVGARRVGVVGELVLGRRDGDRQNVALENLVALCGECSRRGVRVPPG